ncbi:Exodeoxyribonuclease III [Nymphon striatum]|nr:Exodeoxyribonuclease III [Nymphon striatum]
MGYEVVFAGQKNLQRCRNSGKEWDVVTDLPNLDDPQRRILAATINGVRILDLYVVNGSEVGSEKFDYKLDWMSKVTSWVEEQAKKHKKFVILGDFNIAPTDRDVHNPKSWHERILCSTPERNALQTIKDIGFVDSFRLFEQEDEVYSWWDYRSGGFNKNMGLRIDLVLSSLPMAEQCTASYVDPEPRGWDRPSDHAPGCLGIHPYQNELDKQSFVGFRYAAKPQNLQFGYCGFLLKLHFSMYCRTVPKKQRIS